MSKTIKTRPFNVRLFDKNDRNFGVKAFHNHDDGECDLPEADFKVHQQMNESGIRTRCSYIFSYMGTNICACDMCGDKVNYRAAKSRDRHQAQLRTHTLEKLYNSGEDLEELDDSSLESYHTKKVSY